MSAASDYVNPDCGHLLFELESSDHRYYSSNNELINICSVMSRRKVQEMGGIPALSGTPSTSLREPKALQGFQSPIHLNDFRELRFIAQNWIRGASDGVACKRVPSFPRGFLCAPETGTSSARVLLQEHLFDKREMTSGMN
jgi:hypothetical protein